MNPEFLLQIVVGIGSAAGVYAAIRADLARAVLLAQHAHDSATLAHRRIDDLRK